MMTKQAGLAFLLVFYATLANAVPIIQKAQCTDSANDCVTGITGLDVFGTKFNVSFVSDSYSNVYGSSFPYFLRSYNGVFLRYGFGVSSAFDAALALVDALDGQVYGVGGEGVVLNYPSLSEIFIPRSIRENPGGWIFEYTSARTLRGSDAWSLNYGGWYGYQDFPNIDLSADYATGRNQYYAVFEEVPVSEPGALSIVIAGLLALNGVFRRRKAESVSDAQPLIYGSPGSD